MVGQRSPRSLGKQSSTSTIFICSVRPQPSSAIRLADKVLALLHEHADAKHLKRVFFGCSGSDANDTNYKLVRYYNNLRGKPHKKKIISRTGGYHGLTAAATSLTGIPVYHNAWNLPPADVIYTSCPHYYRFAKDSEDEATFCDRMIAEIEAIIGREGADTIGAFIAEPIMGTGGVLLPLSITLPACKSSWTITISC